MFWLKSLKGLLLPFTYSITLRKDITFPVFTTFKSNRSLSYLSVNRMPNENAVSPINSYHNMNKTVHNFSFQFQFVICKLGKSLSTSLIDRIKSNLIFDIHKM